MHTDKTNGNEKHSLIHRPTLLSLQGIEEERTEEQVDTRSRQLQVKGLRLARHRRDSAFKPHCVVFNPALYHSDYMSSCREENQ